MCILQLLDLCMLDADSLQYSYSILAAASVFHSYSRDAALSVSGRFCHHCVTVSSYTVVVSFYFMVRLESHKARSCPIPAVQ